MNIPPYFIVYQRGAVVWRNFCCCSFHALVRAERSVPAAQSHQLRALAVAPEHPDRRAAAS
jgi:hypothetical protein